MSHATSSVCGGQSSPHSVCSTTPAYSTSSSIDRNSLLVILLPEYQRMPLPLLRLPLLASINVIKKLSVTQIFNLIQTSSKVQQLVKISKYPVQLSVSPKSITLKHPMALEEIQVLILVRSESEEHQEKVRFRQNQDQGVLTEWKNEIEGYRRVLDFLVRSFTVQCISFDKMYSDCEVFLAYLEYSKSRGIKFHKVRIWNGTWKEGMAERMLSACSDASEFDLALKCDPNFTFRGFHEFKMNTFDAYLSCGGEWFTVDYMCALINCSRVCVRNLRHWKDVDCNKFMNFWIKSTGRLRSVYVDGCFMGFYPEIALDGIKNMELDKPTAFRIQREDGTKARVFFSNTGFSLNVIDA